MRYISAPNAPFPIYSTVVKKVKNKKLLFAGMTFTFLAKVLLPFFAYYSTAAASVDLAGGSASFTGKVLICSQGGLKWISAAQFFADDSEPQSKERPSCPLCYIEKRDGNGDFFYGIASIPHFADRAIEKQPQYLSCPHFCKPHLSCCFPRAPPAVS